MASIKREKNGTYSVQIPLGINPATGKRASTRKRGLRTQKEAKMYASEIERQVANNEYWQTKKDEKLTYRAAYDIWIEKFERNHEPATTKKAKGMFRNHFLPRFGHMDLKDITPLMINDYSIELSKKFVCCDLMFRRFVDPIYLAHKLEMITRNPAKNVDTPRKKADFDRSKMENFYEEEELDLFLQISKNLAAKNYKQYALFMLLSFSGARCQEVRAQMWRDINFDEGTMFIHRAVTVSEGGEYIAERTKNKASTRRISIDTATLDVMKRWRKIQQARYPDWDENWLVFTNNRDKDGTHFLSTTGIRKWRIKIQDMMDAETGKKIHRIDTHGFRHTHISLLVQNGITLKSVADRAGHTDTTMVGKIYAHTTKRSEEHLRRALTTLLPSSRNKTEQEQ